LLQRSLLILARLLFFEHLGCCSDPYSYSLGSFSLNTFMFL